MSCGCLSRRRKHRPSSAPAIQTTFSLAPATTRPYSTTTAAGQCSSPFLKPTRFTLLGRIERVFNAAYSNETDNKIELPPPLQADYIEAKSHEPEPSVPDHEGLDQEKEKTANSVSRLSHLHKLPNLPAPAGMVKGRENIKLPNRLVLDACNGTTNDRSMMACFSRHSCSGAIPGSTPQREFQPPIPPEPVPRSSASTCSSFPICSPSSPTLCSDHSIGSTSTTPTTQYATVLIPRLFDLKTPPPTPPPTVPLPPIPLPKVALAPRTSSLSSHASVIIPHHKFLNHAQQSLMMRNRGFTVSENGHCLLSSPDHRPRSKSSPLRPLDTYSEDNPTSQPRARHVHSVAPPPSQENDYSNLNSMETRSTKDAAGPVLIAPFEENYSPPPMPTQIQNFTRTISNVADDEQLQPPIHLRNPG